MPRALCQKLRYSASPSEFPCLNTCRCVLADARGRALVLLDELGKGTEVQHATALAAAVLVELTTAAVAPGTTSSGSHLATSGVSLGSSPDQRHDSSCDSSNCNNSKNSNSSSNGVRTESSSAGSYASDGHSASSGRHTGSTTDFPLGGSVEGSGNWRRSGGTCVGIFATHLHGLAPFIEALNLPSAGITYQAMEVATRSTHGAWSLGSLRTGHIRACHNSIPARL